MAATAKAGEADDRHLLGEGNEEEGARARSTEASVGGGRGEDGRGTLRRLYDADPLLFLTILGVCVGILFGLILISTLPVDRKAAIKLIGFPGTILLNVREFFASHSFANACALATFRHSILRHWSPFLCVTRSFSYPCSCSR